MNSLQIGEITISIPVVQGGMGIGISLSKLASAVTNAGGVGVISTVGLGLVAPDASKSYLENNIIALKKEIKKARKLTDGFLGVNIMCVLTNFGDLVKEAIREKIDFIFSGAGLPLDLPKYLKPGSKTKLVPIVSSGRAAQIIAQKWKSNFDYLPDAFVVEGPKAGGHLGFRREALSDPSVTLAGIVEDTLKVTEELRIKYQKTIPVIAAGGIINGRDIYELMQLGASAVQLGTPFIATTECDAPKEFKQAIINAREADVKIIQSPVGMPGRAIINDFLNAVEKGERKPVRCKYHCIRSCNPKTTSYCIANALLEAYRGNLEEGFVFAGANVHHVNKMTTVPEIFRKLVAEYDLEIKYNKSILYKKCITASKADEYL